jgi:NADH:ubiquinone oxidoreductase subunit D
MMELYERVSGARMHAAYVRPGGVAQVQCTHYFALMSFISKQISEKRILSKVKVSKFREFS